MIGKFALAVPAHIRLRVAAGLTTARPGKCSTDARDVMENVGRNAGLLRSRGAVFVNR
jgi:hypothetical protein